ncbi:hypothetical protein INT44_000437 [Umbelopsis vinacea]|uniref:Transmembrane protein 198 n=1 Tax=Umbelopsis vinacea TaxID=44442 RepID=A0A8H7UDZ2_9FUNG|nr:hypothetical protein INT44_000437 [Umbelopsis vinacea]
MRQLHFFTVLIALILSPLAALADPVTDDISNSITELGQVTNAHTIALSVFFFLTGLYLCFAGGLHQQTTVFLAGFWVGANITYIILTNAKPSGFGSNTATILLVVSIVVGILLGGLLACCFFLAIYLLGAFAGYCFALWLLAWASNGLIQTGWGRAILIVVCCLVGVIAIHFLEKPVFIIASAFIGAFLIIAGVDVYVKAGFLEAMSSFVHGATSAQSVWDSTPKLRGELAGVAALAVVGALVQFLHGRRRSAHMPWRERYPYGQYGWKRV